MVIDGREGDCALPGREILREGGRIPGREIRREGESRRLDGAPCSTARNGDGREGDCAKRRGREIAPYIGSLAARRRGLDGREGDCLREFPGGGGFREGEMVIEH